MRAQVFRRQLGEVHAADGQKEAFADPRQAACTNEHPERGRARADGGPAGKDDSAECDGVLAADLVGDVSGRHADKGGREKDDRHDYSAQGWREVAKVVNEGLHLGNGADAVRIVRRKAMGVKAGATLTSRCQSCFSRGVSELASVLPNDRHVPEEACSKRGDESRHDHAHRLG